MNAKVKAIRYFEPVYEYPTDRLGDPNRIPIKTENVDAWLNPSSKDSRHSTLSWLIASDPTTSIGLRHSRAKEQARYRHRRCKDRLHRSCAAHKKTRRVVMTGCMRRSGMVIASSRQWQKERHVVVTKRVSRSP